MLPLAVKQKPFRTTSSLQQNARELILPPQVPAPPPPTIIPDELSSLTNQDYDYGQQTTTYYIETDLLASRPDLQCQPQSQPIPPTRRISKAEQTAEITTSASTSPKTSQSRRKPLCIQLLFLMLICGIIHVHTSINWSCEWYTAGAK